ncbi:uncharacterized protein A4U43_C05F70 [Asparagus officinalis]|uniref:Uncharacterized protein n=1 Tax=Asparagus officinalis TaxID=4686 RepID=A0A5P1ES99_ASPOF|nr:uncharacterized protein A4U43_C05F70 [Asparagus officinalis]
MMASLTVATVRIPSHPMGQRSQSQSPAAGPSLIRRRLPSSSVAHPLPCYELALTPPSSSKLSLRCRSFLDPSSSSTAAAATRSGYKLAAALFFPCLRQQRPRGPRSRIRD